MSRRLALPLSIAAAALSLAACSGGATTDTTPADPPATNASAPSAPAPSGPADSTGGADSAPQGMSQVELTIDGEQITLDGSPTCTSAAGKVSLVYPDGSLAIVLTDGDTPKVDAVSYTNTADGRSLAYAEAAGMGSATATKDGDTYRVEGTASLLNSDGAKDADFSVTFTC